MEARPEGDIGQNRSAVRSLRGSLTRWDLDQEFNSLDANYEQSRRTKEQAPFCRLDLIRLAMMTGRGYPAGNRLSRPFRATGGTSVPHDRRHRCLQGRTSEGLSREFAKLVECSIARRLIVSRHPAIQHTTLDGGCHSNVFCPSTSLRARGHLGRGIRDKMQHSSESGLWSAGTLTFGYEMKDARLPSSRRSWVVRPDLRRSWELASVNRTVTGPQRSKHPNQNTPKAASTGADAGRVQFGVARVLGLCDNPFLYRRGQIQEWILPASASDSGSRAS